MIERVTYELRILSIAWKFYVVLAASLTVYPYFALHG